RAGNIPDAEVVMLMRVGAERECEPAQACDATHLRSHQRYHVIPALERLVVGIALVAIHNRPKPPSINRFKELSKGAIEVVHARSLSESRQPESIRFTPVWPGMLRDIVIHSPDSPALTGEGGVGRPLAPASTPSTSGGKIPCMTKDQVKQILDRVLDWPPQRQEDAARMLREMEQQDASRYRLTDDKADEVERCRADFRDGKERYATDEEIAALWQKCGL